jgi:hypothetical protein
MERSKRARRRKLDTANTDLKPPLAVLRRQGVHREMESEGHEEKYRAAIDGEPQDELGVSLLIEDPSVRHTDFSLGTVARLRSRAAT